MKLVPITKQIRSKYYGMYIVMIETHYKHTSYTKLTTCLYNPYNNISYYMRIDSLY